MMTIGQCLPGTFVVYHAPHQNPALDPGEKGVITSRNELYAFVRYGTNEHSKATAPALLSPLTRTPVSEPDARRVPEFTKSGFCRFYRDSQGKVEGVLCAVRGKHLPCKCYAELYPGAPSVGGAGGTGVDNG